MNNPYGGRPKLFKSGSRVVTVRLDEDAAAKLEKITNSIGAASISYVVRQIIYKYLRDAHKPHL
jgi:metal-responsive CopG/Arc/MetJ family transcriptional regulator